MDPAKFAVKGGVPLPFQPSIKPAVGHGLQLESGLCGSRSCVDSGRLLVPFVCVNGSAHGDKGVNLADHSCMVFSDDHGRTWYLGGIGQAGSREAQLVQTKTEQASGASGIYLSERNMGQSPGHRMYALSEDGGRSVAHTGTEKSLVSPVTAHWTGVVGSVTRLTADDAKSRIAYGGPTDPNSRRAVGIYLSFDEARSWTKPRVVWEGPSAYSDLVPLPHGNIGMIFESGNVSFADRISFATIPLSWMEAGLTEIV